MLKDYIKENESIDSDESYGQHQEDYRIEHMLLDSEIPIEPFIVDVGAGDGQFLSNSKLFVKKYGFRGIMIEPSSVPFKELKNYYKENDGIKCINIAISDKVFNYRMISSKRDKHWTLNFARKGGVRDKKTRLLSELLKDERVEKIGILSIDTEGMDSVILKEFILNSDIKPTVIVIEAAVDGDVMRNQEVTKEYYYEPFRVQFNQVFVLKEYEENISKLYNKE